MAAAKEYMVKLQPAPPQAGMCFMCDSSLAAEDGVKVGLCGHAFHEACIDLWLGSCPICCGALTDNAIHAASTDPFSAPLHITHKYLDRVLQLYCEQNELRDDEGAVRNAVWAIMQLAQ